MAGHTRRMLYSFNKIWQRGVALASVMGDKNLWPRSVPIESQAKLHSGLSVFFPAFNDALSLPSLLERTFETLRRIALDYEVVVNDGSTDATAEVLEELSQTYAPLLRVVTHPRNLGYGAALRSGFAAATKDYIFYTDGDGQYDPGGTGETAPCSQARDRFGEWLQD